MSFRLQVCAALIAACTWLTPASAQSSVPLDYLPALRGD